jgi:hypothetical protein
MKGHKGRKHKATGGADEADEDLRETPSERTPTANLEKEAEEKKRGGRAKKARGGRLHHARGGHHGGHHDGFGPEHHTELKVGGKAAHHHAGRKPRKAGGRTGSEANPFTSARSGSDAPGRKLMRGEAGFGET